MDTKALTKLGYGLYVVTSIKDHKLNGQIANTVFQVCSEPPIIAVALNKQNLTNEFVSASDVFAVSVLSEETPLSFIGAFGFKTGRDVDKFKGVDYRLGETGAPIVLDNALAYLEARVINKIEVGTHTIFIGQIVAADILKEGKPMSYDYYHMVKRGTTPKTAPTYIQEKKEVAQ
jgi:ferric-chelate reductase [NAD(P)H]